MSGTRLIHIRFSRVNFIASSIYKYKCKPRCLEVNSLLWGTKTKEIGYTLIKCHIKKAVQSILITQIPYRISWIPNLVWHFRTRLSRTMNKLNTFVRSFRPRHYEVRLYWYVKRKREKRKIYTKQYNEQYYHLK